MTPQKAIELAIEAMKRRIQKVAVDANLHDVLHVDNPSAVRASRLRKELREAIKILENMR